MKKKGYLDISFSWIFALLIGGMILFGAIYGVSKFSSVAGVKESASSATGLGAIFDSLESASEDASSVKLTFSTLTRIKNNCDAYGIFGKQGIEVEKYLKNSWTTSNMNIAWENKYLFFENTIEGKDFYAFTKPFFYPYKVANLIYLTSENYCFREAPLDIRKELRDLNQQNFYLSECPSDSIKVCFSNSQNCDIVVNYNQGQVEKKGVVLYFESDELMYGAIFADEKNYNCSVSRLMKRTSLLAKLYQEKSLFIMDKCETNIYSDLEEFSNQLSTYKNPQDLSSIHYTQESLKARNMYARCKLW